MSLINDALKRAKEFPKQAPSLQPPEPPFVDGQATAKGPEWMVPVLLCALAAAAALVVGLAFLIFERKPDPQRTLALAVPSPVQAVVTPKPSTPPAPATGQTVAVTAPVSAPPPPPPPPPAPSLRVQGISYSNAKWQAIVNSTTVYVGDSVNGFRVAKISRDNVSFVAPDGSWKTLALGAR